MFPFLLNIRHNIWKIQLLVEYNTNIVKTLLRDNIRDGTLIKNFRKHKQMACFI